MSPVGERVAFELDRFEQTGEDRLEISGRWFGVRGLRFVRPSLTVRTQEGERTLLAVLEHKPWAVEEGEAWVAAFPWTGSSPDPVQAELAVAPSVVVALAGGSRHEAAKRPSLRERLAEQRGRVRHLESEVAWLREEREAIVADRETAQAAAKRASAELAGMREERDAATNQRSRDASALAEAERRLEGALRELERVRDETSRELQGVRDEAVRERAQAAAEREQAIAAARAERGDELSEREHALAAARAERDEALASARAALSERDAALGRGSGFPAISAADLTRQPHARQAASRPAWVPRAVAAIGLLVLVIALALVLRFV